MTTSTDAGDPFPSMPNILFSLTGTQQELCYPGKQSKWPWSYPSLYPKAKAMLFTKSFSAGQPTSIRPVDKTGRHDDASNYRSISLTSICSKVLGHIIYHNVMIYLNSYNILIEKKTWILR